MNKLYQTSTDPFSKQIDTAGSVWHDAHLIVELSDVLGGKPYRDTKVSVIFNGEFLFIRFVCTSDFIEAKMTKPNDPVWEEEAAEVFIQPPGLSNYYFEIDMNPLNTVTDLIVVNNNRQRSERVFNNVREWDCRGLETRVHVEGEMNRDNGCRYWIAEMKIPLFEMPRGDGKEGLCGEWKFNFFRIDRSGEKPQFQAWNPTGRINFHLQDKFMTVNLQKPAKAMILAAGFGSRLKELTKDTPKPLIEIAENYSVIDNVVTQITNADISDIAVNLHYKGDMIRSHLEAKFPDVNWSFFYETEILETGGGILNAREFFSSDFGIVINCDILSYIDLGECISEHRDSGSAASLVIKPVEKHERVLSYNIVNGLTAFYGSDGTVRFGMERFTSPDDLFGDYTGIMIFGKEFFDFMPDKDKFSVIDVFVGMVRQGKKVNVINSGTKYWRDMGTPERLETVRKDFSSFKPVNTDNGIRTIDMLFKGASDKAVYRINYKDAGKKSEVLTVSDNEQELKAWAKFSKFFENTGFKVPMIVNADSSTPMRWILVEDGGKRSLLDSFKEAEFDRNIIRDHVRKAVDLLLELSKIDRDKFPKEHCIREKFDLENIIFDLKYYNKYYLAGKGGEMSEEKIDSLGREIFLKLSEGLPEVIMHRDYQTTNILIDDLTGGLSAVDIQTMRTGYSYYDLASLVIDNYFPLDPDMVDEMIEYFSDKAGYSKEQRELFWVCAYIRKVQNLGAFGRFKDIPFFADKLKPAEDGLLYITENLEKSLQEAIF